MHCVIPPRLAAGLIACLLAAGLLCLAGCAKVPQGLPPPEVFTPLKEDGGVWGVVTDHSGAVIPGAEVTLQDKRKKLTRRAVTDSAGRYAFPGLSPGRYQERAWTEGFKTSKRALEYRSGSQREDFTLELGELKDVIAVSAPGRRVESRRSPPPPAPPPGGVPGGFRHRCRCLLPSTPRNSALSTSPASRPSAAIRSRRSLSTSTPPPMSACAGSCATESCHPPMQCASRN